MRRFRARIASFAPTVFERMTSEISRLSAISSLCYDQRKEETGLRGSHSELDVALSICSSKALLDANQPAIILTAPWSPTISSQVNKRINGLEGEKKSSALVFLSKVVKVRFEDVLGGSSELQAAVFRAAAYEKSRLGSQPHTLVMTISDDAQRWYLTK